MEYKTINKENAPTGVSLDKLLEILNALGVYSTHRPYSETINEKTTWHVKTITYNNTMLETHRPLFDYIMRKQ